MSKLSRMLKSNIVISIVLLQVFPVTAFSMYCSEPREPSCLSLLSLSRDESGMNMCKREIEQYADDADSYVECRLRQLKQEKSELQDKVNDSIRKYNCYAKGEGLCL